VLKESQHLLNGFRALIPARSGSKSLENKNLARYRGFSLLEYAIAAARHLLPQEDVWVSTDSEEYADVAVSAGATVHFIRPKKISKDDSTDFEVFKHAIEFERLNERKIATHWLHLRPTSPMRNPSELVRAIDLFLANPNLPTSLRSVHKAELPVLKWCVKDDLGFLASLSGNHNLDLLNLPRQTYKQVFIPNGYVDIIRSKNVAEGNFLHGEACLGFLTPRISDVDSISELNQMKDSGECAPQLETWLKLHYNL